MRGLQQIRSRLGRAIRPNSFRLMMMCVSTMLVFGCDATPRFTGFCLDECGGGGGERVAPAPPYLVMSPHPRGFTSPTQRTAIMFVGDTMLLYVVHGYGCADETVHSVAWRVTDTTTASIVGQPDGRGRLVAMRPGGFRIQMGRGDNPLPETWIPSTVHHCVGSYDSIVVVPPSASAERLSVRTHEHRLRPSFVH